MQNKKPISLEFIQFLIYPNPASQQLNTRFKILNVIKLWSLQYIITIGLGLAIAVALSFSGFAANQHEVVNLFETSPLIYALVLGLIFAPITEEIAFRLWLKPTKWNLAVSLPFIFILIYALLKLFLYIPLPDWFLAPTTIPGIISYLMFIVLGILGLRLWFEKFDLSQKLAEFFKTHFGWGFYLSALAFGFIHITNYENFSQLLLISVLLVSPQLLAGAVWGFIRTKYGIKWSIAAHMIHNTVSTVPVILLSLTSTDLYTTLSQGVNSLDSLSLHDQTGIILLGVFLTTMFALLLGMALWQIYEWARYLSR